MVSMYTKEKKLGWGDGPVGIAFAVQEWSHVVES